MIDFLEIRDTSRRVVGIVDNFKSVIWNIEYFGIGDFEIYAPFTPENWQLLRAGYYVTRQNERNIGVIEHVNTEYSAQDGRMITATGRFCKSLLTRRIIYSLSGNSVTPVVSRGNVEAAARALVQNNMIAAKDSARNVSFLELGALAGLSAVIVDADGDAAQKQTSYSNLQEYTDEILHEYGAAAYVGIDRQTLQLQYNVYAGADRSKDNAAGNIPLVFSQDFDNMLTSNYDYDETEAKNFALIGGAGEGVGRYFETITPAATGLDRREVFIDASDQSRSYTDESENEQQYSNAEYSQMLTTKARQEMTEYAAVETMAGEIDITNSGYLLGVDFYAGDIVTVQDNEINKYINARIVTVTEVQDDSGYMIEIEFGE